MKKWLKPFIIWKKYKLANKILKHCCGIYIIASNDDYEAKLLTEKQYPRHFVAQNFLSPQSNFGETTRVIEAIDLLEKNGHITTIRSDNLYQFSISCTKHGESAFYYGFYEALILKEVKKILLVVFSVLSVITLILFRRNIIELLQGLFHR